MTTPIPLLIPDMPTAEQLLPWLQKIDQNRWYTNYGPLNAEFERQLLAILDDTGEVALTTVANCTLGLEIVLAQLGLAPGSQVLIPAITFVATGSAVCRANFVPLLADVDSDSWLLTPEIARKAFSERPFSAIMPVSTFGAKHDIDAWDLFTRDTGVPVVFDAASAFGNQSVGQSSCLVFSLHATKSLGVGEGGIVASRDLGFIEGIRRATNFGIDLASPIGNALSSGTNAKLSEYHAAVGLAALPLWQDSIKPRAALHRRYRQELRAVLGASVCFQDADDERVHSLFVIRLPGCRDMQKVVQDLASQSIGARRWYCPPLSHHTAFQACPRVNDLPHSQQLGMELIGLPFYPSLGDEQVRRVVSALHETLRMQG
jgi:dTDP-4-amino-4,6-dideoxygalactose transaminase